MQSVPNKAQRNDYKWPSKHHIKPSDYTTWRNIMKWIFPVDNYKLQDRLGKWNIECRWMIDWDWFISESKEFLYHKQSDGTWHRHLQLTSSHRRYYKEYLSLQEQPTDNLGRTSVCERNQIISVEAYSFKDTIHTNENPLMSSIGTIEVSKPKIEWFMKDIQSSEGTDYLKECLINNTAIAASDGSYSPLERVGSCAWIVASKDGTEWIQGGGVVPGEEHEQNSYRSELGGALGVAVIMDCI